MRFPAEMYALHGVLVLWCILLLAGRVPAVPAGSSITPPPPVEPVQFLAPTQDSRRPWVRLRDSIIEKIWGISSKKTDRYCPVKDGLRRPPPAKALTRYGSDVVLRFELREPDEVKALADAVNVLFLDVWDSTDTFVDIRLAKEVVSHLVPCAMGCKANCSVDSFTAGPLAGVSPERSHAPD